MGQVRHESATTTHTVSNNTAIASFALDAEPGTKDQPHDGRKVA